MTKNTDTYALAYECCDTVFLEDGRFPTIDAIRDRIHVNSPAVIKRAMNDWTLHFVEKHRRRLEHPTMPAVIVDAAESLWKLALLQAEQSYSERKAVLTNQEYEWKRQIAELEKTLADRQSAWEIDRTQLTNVLQAKTEFISEVKSQLEMTTARLDESERALSDTRQSLSRVEGTLTEARSAHAMQAKEWMVKFDQDHDWHLKRIEEEKEALRTQHAKTIADQNRSLEMARMDQESLRARLTQIMNQVGDSLERQSKLETEMELLHQELANKDKALQAERDKSGKLQALIKRQRRPTETQLSTGTA
jgi:chromosome segregation ATPase